MPKGVYERRPKLSIEERWVSLVDTSGGITACHLWLGRPNRDGYGRVWDSAKREKVLAHRYAWERVHGPIPTGMNVLHHCDTPACQNAFDTVNHLYLGTCAENNKEMYAHGRGRNPVLIGELNPSSRITDEIVREIRRRYGYGKRKMLAKEFGLSLSETAKIAQRVTWRHVE